MVSALDSGSNGPGPNGLDGALCYVLGQRRYVNNPTVLCNLLFLAHISRCPPKKQKWRCLAAFSRFLAI